MSRAALWFVLGFTLGACSDGNFEVAATTPDPTDGGADTPLDTSVVPDSSTPADAADTGSGTPDVRPDAKDTGIDTGVDTGVVAPPACDVVPYVSTDLAPGGHVCGVGGCRRVLEGAGCTKPDAGSPCGPLLGTETKPDDLDDNCNGVIDEGRPSASSNAGFECRACAFGRKVQRLTDGSIVTQHSPPDFYGDYANSADCINSDLCKLPGKQWVRHASYPTATTCTQFCKLIGRTCTESCTTTGCAAAANGANLGTFAADYQCMSGSTPLTGSCDATLPSTVSPVNAFNVYCCCAM